MWTCLLFWGPDVQKTVNSAQLQFLNCVVVPVVVQRQVACPAVDADSWRCFRLVHRQGVRGLRRGSFWGPAHPVQDRGSYVTAVPAERVD